MTYECLLYEVKDGIATLTLNRPDRLNALGGTLRDDLFDAVTRTAADPDVRVMVVTGAGKGFCSGETSRPCARPSRASVSARCSRGSRRAATGRCSRCAKRPSPSLPRSTAPRRERA